MTPYERAKESAIITDADTPDEEGVPGIDFLQACAAEALDEVPLLARRCIACAITKGTEANLNQITSDIARRCVERSHPFMCHLGQDAWGEKTHLCAGWAEALNDRAKALTAKGLDV